MMPDVDLPFSCRSPGRPRTHGASVARIDALSSARSPGEWPTPKACCVVERHSEDLCVSPSRRCGTSEVKFPGSVSFESLGRAASCQESSRVIFKSIFVWPPWLNLCSSWRGRDAPGWGGAAKLAA